MGGIRKHRPRNPKKPRTFDPKAGYKDIVRENEAFETFYKAQTGLCPPEEFDEMIKKLKTDLPASFRVTGFRSQAFAVRDLIEGTYFSALANVTDKETEVKIEPPKNLSWYPDRLAWQLSITRKDIRREEALFKLHNFLISETESGNISRQETVSMIPPVVLDVKPHHKVLDMCAAPGSKTAQLIEAIHAKEDVVPKGLVVANDSDNSRCYMLVHQAKRLQSPCVMITNHDASIMPNIKVSDPSNPDQKINLRFDRVLCDVPCSGDGTLRKNADIWPKWAASTGTNLHGVQSRILKRGLEQLAVGGRLVYSTCSLNPVEDEAVLQRILLDAGVENVIIEDASALVPGLRFTPGLNTWKIGVKGGLIYDKWEDVDEKVKNQIRPYMFPSKDNDKMNLNRCMRVLPHQQDTGGFFVAVLTKKALCNWESQDSKNGSDQGKESNGNQRSTSEPPKKKQRKHQGFKEDPYIYFSNDEPIFKEVAEYYGIKELQANMFLTRCKDTTKKNSLYYTSDLVRDIVQSNEDNVKIINTGVKAFTRCENKGATCNFRLAQEGSLMTICFMSKRIIRPTKEDLDILLQCNDMDLPPTHDKLATSTQKQIDELDTGSVGLIFEEERSGYKIRLELVGWKGKNSLRAYVPKQERIHYLRLIGGDVSKYEKNKFEERRAKDQQENNDENTKSNVNEESNGET